MTELVTQEKLAPKRKGRPKSQNSLAAKEMDKVEKQFEDFDKQVKDLTQDRMNMAPKLEVEPQTKMSNREIAKSTDVYLKPVKTIGCRDKFNERFRDKWNHAKEYVQFVCENMEIIGEKVEVWTRPYGGVSAMFWEVPVNTPVWGPRYLAEQLSRCRYHRLMMSENTSIGSDGLGTYTGKIVVDTTVDRIKCDPVTTRTSITMGSKAF